MSCTHTVKLGSQPILEIYAKVLGCLVISVGVLIKSKTRTIVEDQVQLRSRLVESNRRPDREVTSLTGSGAAAPQTLLTYPLLKPKPPRRIFDWVSPANRTSTPVR